MNTKTNIGLILTGWFACLQLLAAAPPSTANVLFQAIRAGDRAAMRTLSKNGADLHARDESGDTPVMAAALNIPPHSPTPVRVLTVPGAAGGKADSLLSRGILHGSTSRFSSSRGRQLR